MLLRELVRRKLERYLLDCSTPSAELACDNILTGLVCSSTVAVGTMGLILGRKGGGVGASDGRVDGDGGDIAQFDDLKSAGDSWFGTHQCSEEAP